MKVCRLCNNTSRETIVEIWEDQTCQLCIRILSSLIFSLCSLKAMVFLDAVHLSVLRSIGKYYLNSITLSYSNISATGGALVALFDTFWFNSIKHWIGPKNDSIQYSIQNKIWNIHSIKNIHSKVSPKYSIQNFIQETGKKWIKNANLMMWFSNLEWEPVVQSGIAKWFRGEKFPMTVEKSLSLG